MKSFCLFVFSVGLFFLSCRFEVDNSNKSGTSQTVETYGGTVKKESEYFKDGKKSSDWLFIHYMDADNSLDYGIIGYPLFRDLNEIESGMFAIKKGDGTPKSDCDSVNYVVLFDGAKAGHPFTHLYDIGPDNNDGAIGSATIDIIDVSFIKKADYEANMADYKTLEKFLLWVNEHYEADHVIFVLGSHGGGPGGDSTYLDVNKSTRVICPDETNAKNRYMSSREFAQAFKNAGYGLSNRLDMMLFDICLGAGFEDAYEIKDLAEYSIVSPEEIPGTGQNYASLLELFNGRKGKLTVSDLGLGVCKNFFNDYYNLTNINGSAFYPTITMIDLSKVEACADAVNSMAAHIMAFAAPDVCRNYFNGVWKYKGLYNYLYDAGKFACKVKEKAADAGVNNSASKVVSALDDMIVWSWKRKNDANDIFVNNAYIDGSYTAENSPYGVTLCGRSSSVLSVAIQPWYRTELEFGRRSGGWADMIMKCFSK